MLEIQPVSFLQYNVIQILKFAVQKYYGHSKGEKPTLIDFFFFNFFKKTHSPKPFLFAPASSPGFLRAI